MENIFWIISHLKVMKAYFLAIQISAKPLEIYNKTRMVIEESIHVAFDETANPNPNPTNVFDELTGNPKNTPEISLITQEPLSIRDLIQDFLSYNNPRDKIISAVSPPNFYQLPTVIENSEVTTTNIDQTYAQNVHTNQTNAGTNDISNNISEPIGSSQTAETKFRHLLLRILNHLSKLTFLSIYVNPQIQLTPLANSLVQIKLKPSLK